MSDDLTRTAIWARPFFSAPNTLVWEDLVSGTASDGWADDVLSWLRLQERREMDLPVLLPYRDTSSAISWFAAARTPQAALELAEELIAYVGPTYADFTGRPHTIDLSNPAEVALAQNFVAPIFRLCPTSPTDAAWIRRVLHIYRGQLERRPPRSRLAPLPIGMLRGRFDRALLVGNADEARRLYDQMLATGRLGADNRLFLEIRLYAGLGLWSQIAGDSRLLRAVCDLTLPPQVRLDVVEAHYRIYAEPWEEKNDAGQALDAFRHAGITRFERLFLTRHGITQPRFLKAFLLHALLRSTPNPTELSTLVECLAGDTSPFTAMLKRLAAERQAPLPPAIDGAAEQEADDAFDDLDYERALSIYTTLPLSRKTIGRLITCASVLREPKAAIAALEALDRDPAMTTSLSPMLTEKVGQLRLFRGEPVAPTGEGPDTNVAAPDSWLSWALWLQNGGAPDRARRLVDERSIAWPAAALAAQPDAVLQLAAALGNATGASAAAVQHAFPRLFQAFVLEFDRPMAAFRPLYGTLLTLIALADTLSQDDLELARTLIAAHLEAGTDGPSYESLILDLEEIFDRQKAVSTFDWALDVAEALALHPAPSPDFRLRYYMKVLDTALAFAHRLDAPQLEALRLLCQDVGIPLPSELDKAGRDALTRAPPITLEGMRIAIYTLTETAGQRATEILQGMYPSLDITLITDTVCTDRLVALAKNADVFVFAWKSSKHQAFYCVKDNRPVDKPLLLPAGKGSASIIREIVASIKQ